MMLGYRDAPLVSRSQESTRCADGRMDQREGEKDDGAIMTNIRGNLTKFSRFNKPRIQVVKLCFGRCGRLDLGGKEQDAWLVIR